MKPVNASCSAVGPSASLAPAASCSTTATRLAMAAMLTVNSTSPAFSSSILATLRTFCASAPSVNHRISSK
ncbi:hypothetical protein D3C78_1800820 [compost metagenome]